MGGLESASDFGGAVVGYGVGGCVENEDRATILGRRYEPHFASIGAAGVFEDDRGNSDLVDGGGLFGGGVVGV